MFCYALLCLIRYTGHLEGYLILASMYVKSAETKITGNKLIIRSISFTYC